MNGDAAARLGTLAICCLFLSGLLILGGSGWRGGPDPKATLPVDEGHPGETVEASGVVVETDPIVLEIEGKDGPEYVRIEGVTGVQKGGRLSVYGTITEGGVLEANPVRSTVQEPWEYAYMYLISLIGMSIVVVRGIRGWRIDPKTLSVIPREEPPHGQGEPGDG